MIAVLCSVVSSFCLLGAFYTDGGWRGALIGTACGVLAAR